MNILLASSEVYPFSKTGGLADMVGALGKALARTGNRIGLLTPLYAGIRERFPAMQQTNLPIDFALGANRVRGEVWQLESVPGLTIYFLDQPGYYQRASLYQKYGVDYPDNAERFLFFSKAAAHLSVHLPWKPELLHVHDWQSACAALFVQHQAKVPGWEKAPRVCLTIHNLAYQGLFPASQYALTNLPWDYFVPDSMEFYGQMNCLKAGIAHSTVITTVSPRYAREITTEELGCGLDGFLRARQSNIYGILNGVDYDEWNPSSDLKIPFTYSLDNLQNKVSDKLELQRELGLPVDATIPIFGSIGRLVEQKGVDLIFGALQEMLGANFQFVLLGTGAAAFEREFEDLARRFPAKVIVKIGFEENLSHRIEAGCDFFLMPSRFEPCGLNQMYSLRYGTIPIVRRTGGLDDTVVDLRDDPKLANGIKFGETSSSALAKAVQKAIALYQNPELLQHYRLNAMRADFSWERTAAEYCAVYDRACSK